MGGVKGRAYGLPKDAYDPLTDHADNPAAHHEWPLTDSAIPAAIARDAEVTASFASHATATNPHSVYQLSSAKAQVGGYAGLDGGGVVPLAQLPVGTSATQVAAGTHTHAVGAGFSAGVSNLGNTAGSTGVTGTRLVMVGTNNITLSQSTDANGGTVSISGPTTAAQTQESQSAGMSNLGNTAGTSGIASGANMRVLFAGGNNITLSQSLNGASGTVTIVGPTTAAQTNQSIGVYALGNTTGQSSSSTQDARSHSVQGDGIISVGMSAGVLRLSATVAAQTAESQSFGMSNLGNSAGTSGIASGANVRFLLAGGNNITLSQSLNGASGTISIVGPAAGGAFSAGVSNLGNTAGATGVTGTRMVLVGAANITLSQTTDANGNTVSMSVAAPGGGNFSMGVSNLGNTAGSTGVTGTRLVLVGNNNVTLSQSTDANGGTISLNAPAGGAGNPMGVFLYNSGAMYSLSSSAHINATLTVVRLELPAQVSFTRIGVLHSVSLASSATSNTAAVVVSSVAVLYSRNVSTLSPLVGASGTTTYSWASNSGVVSSLTGARYLTMALASTIGPGEFYLGWQMSTATSSVGANTTNLTATLAPQFGTRYSAAPWLPMSIGLNGTDVANNLFGFQGLNSVTLSATSLTLQASQMTVTGTAGVRANLMVLFQA